MQRTTSDRTLLRSTLKNAYQMGCIRVRYCKRPKIAAAVVQQKVDLAKAGVGVVSLKMHVDAAAFCSEGNEAVLLEGTKLRSKA
jgi:hypothetical protein